MPGAVAAPAAGLHCTPEVLNQVEAKGVTRVALTLDVGVGTFRPVEADDPQASIDRLAQEPIMKHWWDQPAHGSHRRRIAQDRPVIRGFLHALNQEP